MSRPSFSFTTFLHWVSIIISALVTGLAAINFGVLSIWINSTAGALNLVYHITILVLNWRRGRRALAVQSSSAFESISSTIKLPTPPSPTYAPPPYEPEKFTPNRRPISRQVIPGATKPAVANFHTNPFGAFYSIPSLFSAIFLEVITLIGFGMTVQVSVNGAMSLLPAERAKGMTLPWNMNIQKAQCTFLGMQVLLALVTLVLCATGRYQISKHEDEMREEIECGFDPSESTHHSVFEWNNGVV